MNKYSYRFLPRASQLENLPLRPGERLLALNDQFGTIMISEYATPFRSRIATRPSRK